MTRATVEKSHRLRFVPDYKRRAIQYATDERRERMGKKVVKLHETFKDNAFPDAREIREWAEDFHHERGLMPTTLLYPYRSITRQVIIWSKNFGSLCLVVKPSEFLGLE